MALKTDWTLDQAIQWIADEDSAGDNDSVKHLAGFLTVALVADMFGVGSNTVAIRVWKKRNPVG